MQEDHQRVDGVKKETAPHGIGPYGALYTAPLMGVRVPKGIVQEGLDNGRSLKKYVGDLEPRLVHSADSIILIKLEFLFPIIPEIWF